MRSDTTKRFLRPALVLVAVLSTLAVLAAGTVGFVGQPACTLCHTNTAFVAATTSSSHAGSDCASCHVAPGLIDRSTFGFAHVGAVVASGGSARDRDLAYVPDDRCLRCHDDVTERPSASKGIRISHLSCATDSPCTSCHSAVAHGTQTSWLRVYDMETCLGCHATQAVSECDTCHDGRPAEDRITSGVFAVTHGERWRETHGMGNSSTCTVCHSAASCEGCHGAGLPHDAEFIRTHSEIAGQRTARCETCHAQTFCDDCHGTAMPHSNSFTRTHAKPGSDDRKLCDRCHVESDCVNCHVKHVHPGGAIGAFDEPETGR